MLKNRFLGLLLIVVLIYLPAACKKSEEGLGTFNAEKDVQNMIAKNAIGFIVFKMNDIANKGLLDEITKDPESQMKVKEFKTKFGLDLKKDLGLGLVVLLDLPGEVRDEEKDLYFVFMGTFDKDKILNVIKSNQEVKVEDLMELGYKIHHIIPTQSSTDEAFLTFKNNNMLLGAVKKEHLLTACQVVDGKRPNISKGSKLGEMFANVDKTPMIWGLFSIPEEKAGSAEGPAAMFPSFNDIRHISFGGSYDGKTLSLIGNLFTSKPESIKQLASSLNSMKEMFKGFASQSPDSAKALEIIDTINITSDRNSVRITLTLTKEQMEMMQSEGFGMGPK